MRVSHTLRPVRVGEVTGAEVGMKSLAVGPDEKGAEGVVEEGIRTGEQLGVAGSLRDIQLQGQLLGVGQELHTAVWVGLVEGLHIAAVAVGFVAKLRIAVELATAVAAEVAGRRVAGSDTEVAVAGEQTAAGLDMPEVVGQRQVEVVASQAVVLVLVLGLQTAAVVVAADDIEGLAVVAAGTERPADTELGLLPAWAERGILEEHLGTRGVADSEGHPGGGTDRGCPQDIGSLLTRKRLLQTTAERRHEKTPQNLRKKLGVVVGNRGEIEVGEKRRGRVKRNMRCAQRDAKQGSNQ